MKYEDITNAFHHLSFTKQLRSGLTSEGLRYYTNLEGAKLLNEMDVEYKRVGSLLDEKPYEGYTLGDFIFEIDPKKITERGVQRIDEKEQGNYILCRKLAFDKQVKGTLPLEKAIVEKQKRRRSGETPVNRVEDVGGIEGRIRNERGTDHGIV